MYRNSCRIWFSSKTLIKRCVIFNLPHALDKFNCAGASLRFKNRNTFYHSVSHGVQQQCFLLFSYPDYFYFIVTCHFINYSK
jgi:hypothetical protein